MTFSFRKQVVEAFPAFELHLLTIEMYNLVAQVCLIEFVCTFSQRKIVIFHLSNRNCDSNRLSLPSLQAAPTVSVTVNGARVVPTEIVESSVLATQVTSLEAWAKHK